MFGNSVTTAMTDQQTSNATDEILRELMDCVSSLKEDVAELKKRNDDATATSAMESRKRPRDGDAGADLRDSITRDGEDDRSQQYSGDGDSDSDPAGGTDSEDYIPSDVDRFQVSEEGEAFLETAFTSKLKYATRKAKVAKYGQPDSKWAMCPELGSVVEGILPNEALKLDKATFRSQEMWLEAAGPISACLERAHQGTLTLPEVIPMLQTSLVLMGDASQHQSSMRRQVLLEQFNPHLKKLMKDKDFAKAQPYLFGQDFGQKAKEKLDAAEALRKVVYKQPPKGKANFQGGYPRNKQNWGKGGGRNNNYGPGKSKKRSRGTTNPTGKPPGDK